MKVEELYSQGKDSQVGVTFQRQPFETCVDIFPEISPLEEPRKSVGMSQHSGEPVESALTSVQMEEAVCRVVKHKGEEEFQPIPLKRIDSGPTSHRLQGVDSECEGGACVIGRSRNHQEMMDEIDSVELDVSRKEEVKLKKEKKESTLSRMKDKLKTLRGEKAEKDEEGKSATKSLSKIFHRVNPVGKASRESFSKVFHKIGDALQRKEEDKEEVRRDKLLDLDKQGVERTLKHQDSELL